MTFIKLWCHKSHYISLNKLKFIQNESDKKVGFFCLKTVSDSRYNLWHKKQQILYIVTRFEKMGSVQWFLCGILLILLTLSLRKKNAISTNFLFCCIFISKALSLTKSCKWNVCEICWVKIDPPPSIL